MAPTIRSAKLPLTGIEPLQCKSASRQLRGSRHGINASLGDPGLEVIGIESHEFADLAERDATFIDQSSDESGSHAEPRGDLSHVEQCINRGLAV
jgi:hypothetical protein